MTNLFGEEIHQETKKCGKCGETKPLSEYSYANGARYQRSACKVCEKKLNETRKRLREENLDTFPDSNYKCPICLRTENEVKGKGGKTSGTWCCDHDHITNKFRGWLCHSCNRAIGGFNEDVERMHRAIEWVKKHG